MAPASSALPPRHAAAALPSPSSPICAAPPPLAAVTYLCDALARRVIAIAAAVEVDVATQPAEDSDSTAGESASADEDADDFHLAKKDALSASSVARTASAPMQELAAEIWDKLLTDLLMFAPALAHLARNDACLISNQLSAMPLKALFALLEPAVYERCHDFEGPVLRIFKFMAANLSAAKAQRIFTRQIFIAALRHVRCNVALVALELLLSSSKFKHLDAEIAEDAFGTFLRTRENYKETRPEAFAQCLLRGAPGRACELLNYCTTEFLVRLELDANARLAFLTCAFKVCVMGVLNEDIWKLSLTPLTEFIYPPLPPPESASADGSLALYNLELAVYCDTFVAASCASVECLDRFLTRFPDFVVVFLRMFSPTKESLERCNITVRLAAILAQRSRYCTNLVLKCLEDIPERTIFALAQIQAAPEPPPPPTPEMMQAIFDIDTALRRDRKAQAAHKDRCAAPSSPSKQQQLLARSPKEHAAICGNHPHNNKDQSSAKMTPETTAGDCEKTSPLPALVPDVELERLNEILREHLRYGESIPDVVTALRTSKALKLITFHERVQLVAGGCRMRKLAVLHMKTELGGDWRQTASHGRTSKATAPDCCSTSNSGTCTCTCTCTCDGDGDGDDDGFSRGSLRGSRDLGHVQPFTWTYRLSWLLALLGLNSLVETLNKLTMIALNINSNSDKCEAACTLLECIWSATEEEIQECALINWREIIFNSDFNNIQCKTKAAAAAGAAGAAAGVPGNKSGDCNPCSSFTLTQALSLSKNYGVKSSQIGGLVLEARDGISKQSHAAPGSGSGATTQALGAEISSGIEQFVKATYEYLANLLFVQSMIDRELLIFRVNSRHHTSMSGAVRLGLTWIKNKHNADKLYERAKELRFI